MEGFLGLHALWFLVDFRTLLVFIALLLVLGWFLKQPKNLPPGPRGFPLIGSVLDLFIEAQRGSKPHHLLAKYGKRYGPVCSVRFLNKTLIILNDFESSKEAFQHPVLSNRPSSNRKGRTTGVTTSNGEQWTVVRRFTLTVLRSFGIGKASFEERIGTEGKELLKELSAFDGKPFDPKPFFANAVSNVICSVVFGQRYEYKDADFKGLISGLSKLINSLGTGGFFYFFSDLAYRLPFVKAKIKQLRLDFLFILDFITSVIDSHRPGFDPHNLNDFIDVYLNEIKKNEEREAKGNSEAEQPATRKYLNEQNFTVTVADLFGAGTETTATTMEWCLLYMAIYPDIQKRVQAEIDAVVGRNRLPRLADKSELNLTQAVLWEIQRMACIVPLGLMHVAASDVIFRGFFIPEGAHVISNMFQLFKDEKVWPEPDKFKPERFLNDEGNAFRPEEFIPFGIGRRVCLGKHLAKMELFIFFSYFIHQFTIKPPEGAPPLTLEGKSALTYSPLPFKICLVSRD